MKLKNIEGLLPKAQTYHKDDNVIDQYVADGFNGALAQVAEKELEIDMERVKKELGKRKKCLVTQKDGGIVIDIELLAQAIAKACPIRVKEKI